MEISVRNNLDVQLVQLRGDLRLGEPVDELRRVLDELVSAGKNRIVLDLSEVPMMDSSGIGILVRFLASTKKRGGSLKLVNPSDFNVKTLRVVGVLNLFQVFTSDAEAVQSFKASA